MTSSPERRNGKGFVGLSKWMGRGLAFEIEQHNKNGCEMSVVYRRRTSDVDNG